jgi:hypothetical protein
MSEGSSIEPQSKRPTLLDGGSDFHQLVEQQPDFNALYLAQGQALSDGQREALADAAF